MRWTLEVKKISELSESTKNPRRMTKEQAAHLKESILKFGTCEPIVANIDGQIIGGHQRYRVLKSLGYKDLHVYIPDRFLEEHEVDELNIRLNKNTGDWDFDILANHYDPIDLISYGFTSEDLHMESIQGSERDEDGNKKETPAKMYITFSSAEQLQEAENRIATIVDEFSGAKYRVKI